MKKNYQSIIEHYEKCLEKFGDSHLGVDWPKEEDVDMRYKVMLGIFKFQDNEEIPVSILDFGCGAAHLYEYILKNNLYNIKYSGLDISEKFINLSKAKFPHADFYCGDILDAEIKLPQFDYVVMNGVFTEKRDLSFEDMWEYFKTMIDRVFKVSKRGIAFNVMSKHVEWERGDLFHLPFDLLGDFLCKKISRDFVVRNDYGLYEYTVYVLKR